MYKENKSVKEGLSVIVYGKKYDIIKSQQLWTA